MAGSSRESAEANGENITDRGRSDKLERANDIDRYKIDELIADPYWNPKKIELDAARRDVLNKLIEDGRRREKAARSQWNRLSLTSTQKMESAGRYATGIAMPASIYTNLNAPDVATAVANLTSGLEAPHFKVWYRIVLPASDFPMLTVSKRRLDDARIFLHDAVKRYF
ncbi:MAG: hypothetical protein HY286_08440 [Planctomycetes bacterium]|nr:hypothetical protein [Planctomycetota bacterium]